ncbi:MAG TPA: VWA domain-containing protein [Polyangiaceae bacterium]
MRLAPLSLALLSVVFGIFAASACGDSDSKKNKGKPSADAGADVTTDAGQMDLFTAWQRVREALRQSPDHLAARADARVAAKNAEGLFHFVRDDIATYPPSDHSFESALFAQRWGTRGTLRGGAGTPREKAELLVELYERAGFEAEVVRGDPDPARLDGKKILLRSVARLFAPAITSAESATYLQALGHSSAPPRTLIDADGARTRQLAASLLPLLPTDASAPFDFTLGPIPLVRVRVDGTWKFANPIAPGAAFGDPVTLAEPIPTGGAGATPPLFVKLEGARADAPYERFTLVERRYEAEDVVGRRVHIGFAPPASTDTLLTTHPKNLDTFVPLVTVSAPGLDQAEKERLAAVGKPISVRGDLYEVNAGGALTVNGAALAAVTTDPAAVQSVTAVTAGAQAAGFPQIRLQVSATDAAGRGVPRLGASAFEVLEGGQPVTFTVTQNEAPPPRVVLVFDASTSVPAAFRGAGAVTVAQNIINPLYAEFPNAQVRIGVISFGANWLGSTYAATASAALTQAQGLSTATGGSEIWEALADANAQSPTLIVLVTDGEATDEAEARFTNRIASGAPVLSLGVGTVTAATLDQISTLSAGTDLAVTQQSEAVNAVLSRVRASRSVDYVLSYQAPKAGSSPRSVAVTINGKRAQTTYEVPASPATPGALSGLYLTVRVGGREVTRALAGFDQGYTTAFTPVTEAELADVRALLLGRVSLSVEAASPTASQVYDDWISEKLQLAPLWQAARANDQSAMKAAFAQGFSLTPSKLLLAQAPLRDAASTTSLTFETGLRVTSVIQKTREGGPVTRQLDVFPLTQWATAAEDPRTAFERTLTATASLAVLESELFQKQSTLKALTGQTLLPFMAGTVRDQAGLTDAERLKWAALEEHFPREYQLLTPGKPGPFWAVDTTTGTVMGMLQDGTGGATEDACATYDAANSYIQLMSLLGGLFGVSMGGWTALAQWEVKYVTVATIVIGGGAVPDGAADLTNPAFDMACGAADDALGDRIPGLGTYESAVGTADTTGMDTGLPTVCGGGGDLCR